jgi:hypothetical protein
LGGCGLLVPLQEAEHPIGFALHDAVAPTRGLFEPPAIDDRDLTACRLDEALALEEVERLRHAGPPHAQHDRDVIVGERNVVPLEAVVAHQEPAREPLAEVVTGVAGGRLRGVELEQVGIGQQHLP